MIYLDSFSGPVAELKRGAREDIDILRALQSNPRVSTFDLGECRWLRVRIADMKHRGLLVEEQEPYPWHRLKITEAGAAILAKLA